MGLSLSGQMKGAVCALVMTSGGGAAAQDIAAGIDPQTQAGLLSIEESGDGFSRVLVVGSQRFSFDGEYQYINIVDKRGSLYLVELNAGGNACAAAYLWLHTSGTPRVSDIFGTCAYQSEVRADAETVTVVMASPVASEGRVGFVYDGSGITEIALGQISAGVGRSPEDWVGQGPYTIFADADWQPDLVALMGEDAYRYVGQVVAISSGMVVEGQWVVGEGVNPRVTGDARGVIAIHLTDGRILVAVREGDGSIQGWGDLDGEMPPMMERLIDGG